MPFDSGVGAQDAVRSGTMSGRVWSDKVACRLHTTPQRQLSNFMEMQRCVGGGLRG